MSTASTSCPARPDGRAPAPSAGRGRRAATAALAAIASVLVQACGGGGGGGGGGGSPGADGSPPDADPSVTTPAAGTGADIVALIATAEESLYRLRPDGSNLELVHELEGGLEFVGLPDVLGTTVYGGSDDNALNAIDLVTGAFLWDAPIGEYRRDADDVSGVACLPDRCLVVGDNGVVLAVDPSSGRRLWARSLRPDGDVSGDLDATTPLVANGRAYIVSSLDGLFEQLPARLTVLDVTEGAVLADIPLVPGPGATTPQLVGDTLLIGGGALRALDARTLETRWSAPAGRTASPAAAQGVVVAHLFSPDPDAPPGSLIAGFDLATGAPLWSAAGGSEQSLFDVVADGVTVYAVRDAACGIAGCRNGDPIAIDPLSGALLWESPVAGVDRAPTVAGGRLLYADINDSGDENGFGALDPRDGSLVWAEPRLGSRVSSAVAIAADGTVFRPPWAPPARR